MHLYCNVAAAPKGKEMEKFPITMKQQQAIRQNFLPE